MELGSIISVWAKRIIASAYVGSWVAFPSQVGSFQFQHVEEGITFSISQAAPPRAILEDELIAPLKVLPETRPALKKGQVRLGVQEESSGLKVTDLEKEYARVIAQLERIANKKIEVAPEPQYDVRNIQEPIVIASYRAETTFPDIERTPAAVATEGDAIPEFGRAFDETTVIEERGTDAVVPPGHEPEDLIRDPQLATLPDRSIKPAVVIQNVAKADPPIQKPKESNGITMASVNSRQVIFEGKIELTKGLAFSAGSRIEVYHEVLGEPAERGRVQISEGRYEILIDRAEAGSLIAELRDQEDLLLGHTEIRLGEGDYSNLTGQRKILDLVLGPRASGLEGLVGSGYGGPSAGATVRVAGLHTDVVASQKGRFATNEILPGSNGVIRVSNKDHWGSVALADFSSAINLTLYHNKTIEALAGALGIQEPLSASGVIWGRVEQDQKPVEGARVELAEAEAIGPIYFNALQLPDEKLESTGTNGMFVFLRVTPGLQVVRATKAEKTFPAKVIATEARHVSPIVLDSTRKRSASLALYDAHDGRPLEASVELVSVEKTAETKTGLLGIRYNIGADLLFLEAESGLDYSRVRLLSSRDVGHINVPFPRKLWLEEVGNARRINRLPHTGLIVGFIKGSDFTVKLPAALQTADLIYFDSAGKFSPDAVGSAGGGFIVYNAEPGLHTLSINPIGKKGVAVRAAFVDSRAVSLIDYKF